MSYLQECLAPGERLVQHFSLSLVAYSHALLLALAAWAVFDARFVLQWLASVTPASAWVVLVVVGRVLDWLQAISRGWLLPAVAVILAAAAARRLIAVACVEYGLTTWRVVQKNGWLARTSTEIQLGAVETVDMWQGIPGRMLNYGTVVVTGRGQGRIVFRRVNAPVQAKRTIETACQEYAASRATQASSHGQENNTPRSS